MALRICFILVFFCVSVTLSLDLRVKKEAAMPTEEECMRPPLSKGHECCRLPKERIWGDLRSSLSLCLKKVKQIEPKPIRQEMAANERGAMTPEGLEAVTPTEVTESESTSFEHRGKHHSKKSQRLKDLFATVYKEIKNTFTSIWSSVVIITDQFRQHFNDSCFMECVFDDQGFLLDHVVMKDAILNRFSKTLAQNEFWQKVAVEAVESCFHTKMAVASNGTCNSGSEEMFRCILKQIFFSCPSWTQTPYCMALKEFYQKCPNGPPPEIIDHHSTVLPPPVEDVGGNASTENETSTEPE